MSKYDPLTEYLTEFGGRSLSMSFEEIEKVIDTILPPSAFKHRSWWSNNETNSVITKAWLNAGYKTRNVDMNKHELEFYKFTNNAKQSLKSFDERPSHSQDFVSFTQERNLLTCVTGVLKGTVTIYPGTDLTKPLGEQWDVLK